MNVHLVRSDGIGDEILCLPRLYQACVDWWTVETVAQPVIQAAEVSAPWRVIHV